jgi:hypothetical protein
MAARVAALSAIVSVVGAAPSTAQDEAALRDLFEGRRVTVLVDMPGSSDGVDLEVDSPRPLDYEQYGDRLRSYGAAIRADRTATVTLVKLKRDLIEFQLDGGGFGVFQDDSSTSVSIRPIEKSAREKELEKEVSDETNPRRQRELERQLDALRIRRERENRRIDALRAEAEDRRKERVAAQRLRGGSRFNLRYEDRVPPALTAADVIRALDGFVEFPRELLLAAADGSAPVAGIRKGMTRAEVERTLGRPASAAERHEGRLRVMTLVFEPADRRITADFVEDVLVRFDAAPE